MTQNATEARGRGQNNRSKAPTDGTASAQPGRWAWSNVHPIDLRLSIPLPTGRYYVTLVAGRERRGFARRAADARRHPLITWGNLAAIFVLGSISGLAALALMQLVSANLFQELGMMRVAS